MVLLSGRSWSEQLCTGRLKPIFLLCICFTLLRSRLRAFAQAGAFSTVREATKLTVKFIAIIMLLVSIQCARVFKIISNFTSVNDWQVTGPRRLQEQALIIKLVLKPYTYLKVVTPSFPGERAAVKLPSLVLSILSHNSEAAETAVFTAARMPHAQHTSIVCHISLRCAVTTGYKITSVQF